MKCPSFCLRWVLLALVFLPAAAPSLQAAAIWNKTNAAGLWRYGTNWSSSPSAPTLATGGTYVTNRTTKTVTVDAATPLTNLFIGSLNVWGPPGTTNRLLLQDLGATPLVLSNNSLDVRMRGDLQVTNSSLVVTGNFIQFNLWAGTLTLDSGSIVACDPGLSTNCTIPFRVGRTNAAEFQVNGGSVTLGALAVGQAGLLNSRSHGTIRMTGGEMLVLGEYSVGNAANCTGVVHMTGGTILLPAGNTNTSRIGDDGDGTMTLSNASFTLNNLSVSRHTNSLGRLVLHTNGLLVARDDVSVGRFPGSRGSLFVAGGDLVCTNQTLWIGREGRGSLVVSNGGIRADSLHVGGVATNGSFGTALLAGGVSLFSSNLVIGTLPGTTGEVVVAGGQVLVTNRDYAAYLDVPLGTLTLAGGMLAVDNLTLTNPAGIVQFQGGTLQASFSQVANGAPFVVGDGVQPATLVLGAGTHVFADGLVISPNATVTGCATILGQVINNGGTLSTSNCVPLPIAPRILKAPASLVVTQGATAIFTATVSGSPVPGLQWHFTPEGGTETALPGATNGTLTLVGVLPAQAGSYRLEASNSSGVASATATLQLLLPPSLGAVTFSTTSASVAVATLNGQTYVLEYKAQLGDPAWTPLLTTNGTGDVLILTDNAPGLPTRFYRVRME